ncbi:alpha/beta-hydrolase, partial [Martensiomyces pterosporus]
MPSSPISRPYVAIRLGDQVFQTSVAKAPSGSWNEGFELVVSYHMQLFGTVHLDVYSSNTLLPDTHVGRAEIKISLLEGFPEIFTSYYEIWDKKLAASTVPDQRQRHILSKNLGALQVRVNYRYQRMEDPEPPIAKVHGAHIVGTTPGQLSNQKTMTGGDVNPADMPIEDLVAGFANEYNQYIEMVRRQGHMAIVRNSLAKDGTKSTVGFTKMDSDTYVAGTQGAGGESPGTDMKGGATGGWFSDWLAAPPNTASEPTSDDSPAPTVPIPAERQDSVAAGGALGRNGNDKTLMQSLASMFISPSTFKAIKSLDRLVTAFNQGVELSNAELIGGLLTLYKFYNEADIPGVTRPHKGTMVESVQELEVPGHYARFALASYGWRALYFFNRGITLMDGAKVDSDVTSVLQYLNITQEDLLGYEFRSSEVFCPSYFVAHDRPYNAVALVVRGTMSAEDTVVDLSCEYSKWNGGLVHSGMRASAHWLFVKVMPQIFAYAKSQNVKSIRIVGHSLGASTAAILVIMLRTLRERLDGLGVDSSGYDIKAYCYGPAPCISDNLAERFRDCIETYVNKDDVVPRLCYGSVSDFKRMSISASDEADNL